MYMLKQLFIIILSPIPINLLEIAIVIPERTFPQSHVEKWTALFKKSELCYDF